MTTLKGIFPDTKTIKGKNFIYENIKNLRRIEHYNAKKETNELHILQQNNRKKITANLDEKRLDANEMNPSVNNKLVHQSHGLNKRSSIPMLFKNNLSAKKVNNLTNNNVLSKQRKKEHKGSHKSAQKLLEKVSSDPHLSHKSIEDISNVQVKTKSQGIQTLDTRNIEDLYSEGIIKSPTKKYVTCKEVIQKDEPNEPIEPCPKNIPNSPLDHGDVQVVEENVHSKNDIKKRDFIKLNKESISKANKAALQLDNNTSAPNYRIGVVPKYIKSRRKNQKKSQVANEEIVNSACPSGHVPLPDSERKETLQILRKSYQDYVNELNMLPIKVDTLRAQQRKIEIEKQLNKLEEGIKVFSRPKVYIEVNS